MVSKNGKDNFGPALTDFMSGVAVVFLCLAAAYIVRATQADRKYGDEKKRKEEVQTEILKEIAQILGLELSEGKLLSYDNCYEVESDPDNYKIYVRFKSDADKCKGGLVFPRAKPRLAQSPESDAKFILVASKICEKIGGVENGKTSDIDRVELLGHTDADPFLDGECDKLNDNHCGNLGLSALRARQVFLYLWDAQGGEIKDCLAKYYKISGRADFEPLKDSANSLGSKTISNSESATVTQDISNSSNFVNDINKSNSRLRRVEYVIQITPPQYKSVANE